MNSQNPGDGDSGRLSPDIDEVFTERSSIVRAGGSKFAQLLLGSTPWAGGVGAAFAHEIQRRQNQRLASFLREVVEYVEDRVDEQRELNDGFVSSDQFTTHVETVLSEVARTADEAKLRFLRNFLVSGILDPLDFSVREFHANILARLAGVHLVAISLVADAQGRHSLADLEGSVRVEPDLPLPTARLSELGGFADEALCNAVCSDLAANGLLRRWAGSVSGTEFVITRTGLAFAAAISEPE